MKKLIVSAFAVSMLLVACGEKKEAQQKEGTEQVQQNALTGLYIGELPCASCPGILTHLTLEEGGKAAITRLYYDSDNTSFTDFGTWEQKENLIIVDFGEEKLNYLISEDGSLKTADKDGGLIDTIEEYRTLVKSTPKEAKDFVGTFEVIAEENIAKPQLIIEDKGNNKVKVNVNLESLECENISSMEGVLVNNQIEVDLSKINKDLRGVLVIRFNKDDKTLNVSTSVLEDRGDLIKLCEGGKDFSGNYQVKN